ncbi:hypothetical protein N9O56_01025 [Rickettsiales bacterium]|nr:hypothetical protein [Rickettsiales bacterium]
MPKGTGKGQSPEQNISPTQTTESGQTATSTTDTPLARVDDRVPAVEDPQTAESEQATILQPFFKNSNNSNQDIAPLINAINHLKSLSLSDIDLSANSLTTLFNNEVFKERIKQNILDKNITDISINAGILQNEIIRYNDLTNEKDFISRPTIDLALQDLLPQANSNIITARTIALNELARSQDSKSDSPIAQNTQNTIEDFINNADATKLFIPIQNGHNHFTLLYVKKTGADNKTIDIVYIDPTATPQGVLEEKIPLTNGVPTIIMSSLFSNRGDIINSTATTNNQIQTLEQQGPITLETKLADLSAKERQQIISQQSSLTTFANHHCGPFVIFLVNALAKNQLNIKITENSHTATITKNNEAVRNLSEEQSNKLGRAIRQQLLESNSLQEKNLLTLLPVNDQKHAAPTKKTMTQEEIEERKMLISQIKIALLSKIRGVNNLPGSTTSPTSLKNILNSASARRQEAGEYQEKLIHEEGYVIANNQEEFVRAIFFNELYKNQKIELLIELDGIISNKDLIFDSIFNELK